MINHSLKKIKNDNETGKLLTNLYVSFQVDVQINFKLYIHTHIVISFLGTLYKTPQILHTKSIESEARTEISH